MWQLCQGFIFNHTQLFVHFCKYLLITQIQVLAKWQKKTRSCARMTKKSDLLQTEMSCRRTIFSLDLRQVRPIFCHFPYACIGMASRRRSSSFLPSRLLFALGPQRVRRLTLETDFPVDTTECAPHGGRCWSRSSNRTKISTLMEGETSIRAPNSSLCVQK